MKQTDLFKKQVKKEDISEYVSKVRAPIYEPKNKPPHVLELLNNAKANRLKNEINGSNVSEEEKKFLIEASKRHNVFNYSKVADYYAHATPEMQHLMEKSALIIIDFEKAIQYGYVKLSKEIANLYFEDYGE